VSAVAPRPSFHFTPPSGWMNDPNGLIVVDGTFHLFYQHNPTDVVWGNLHWGHATSVDLLTWEHQPVALRPDKNGEIFSGSVVCDEANTAGFGAGALVAVFTNDLLGKESQSLAHSLDGGQSWATYSGNPVITAPEQLADFRDPKVLRCIGEDGCHWTMLLAVGPEIWLYRSADLVTWSRSSVFVPERPYEGALFEVPDLVAVPIHNGSEKQWVLTYSVLSRTDPKRLPRTMCWQVVDFDGLHLSSDAPVVGGRLDHGFPFYAGMSWDSQDADSPVLIAWLDETQQLSGSGATWCGRLSIPRRLSLVAADSGLRLRQTPALKDDYLRPVEAASVALNSTKTVKLGCRAIVAQVDGPVLVGPQGQVAVSVQFDDGSLVAVELSGETAGFSQRPEQEPVVDCQVKRVAGSLSSMVLVIDAGSVEVFVDDGVIAWSVLTPSNAKPEALVVVNSSTHPVDTTVHRLVVDEGAVS